jgi:hypothetical protein
MPLTQSNRLLDHLVILNLHSRLPQRIPSIERYDPTPILHRKRDASMSGRHGGTARDGEHEGDEDQQDWKGSLGR